MAFTTVRPLALSAGLTLILIGAAASASAAGTHTLHLHGTMMARHAMAAAVVTQTSPGDYKVTITAADLPAPAMMHLRSPHRVYVAWASDGNRLSDMGMAATIPLHTTRAGGYTGSRVVMLRQVARIFVTAEGSAMTHHPSMGAIVLDSGMMR